jgi:vanillate/4-hydroxybenzoate decarboxylase subunit C
LLAPQSLLAPAQPSFSSTAKRALTSELCVPLYEQLKKDYPEVQAVNAMYTHGLVVIVSTKKRYGGFAKAGGMRGLTTPHGLGYAATVIVVDDDVDPFNLPQVM